MLEAESGISPDVIAARGYWTETEPQNLIALGFAEYQCRRSMGPFLVIPEWSTAGVQIGYKLRPDNPRTNQENREKPKPIKYESAAGSQLLIDCPPTMTHKLRDVSTTLYFTEGGKKADAAASNGSACVSLNGTYGFMRGKLVIPDLDDIALKGRRVRVAFDSDVTTNPNVAEAMMRLAETLRRRGAKVEIVTFASVDGRKIGLDDYFAVGGAVEGLDALSTPYQRMPTSIVPDDADASYWKSRALKAEALVSAQAEVLRNPLLKDKPRIVGFAAVIQATAKISRGEVEPDGRAKLNISHVVNDFRPKPPKGESMPEANPHDGSLPLTSRETGKSVLKLLAANSAIDAEFVPVKRQHASGDWYNDTDILIRVTTPVEAMRQLASFDEHKARKAYRKQEECSQCGEVHARTVETTRKTYCGTADDPGCGAQIDEKTTTLILPVPSANDPDATEEQRDGLARVTAIDPDNIPNESGSGKNPEANTTGKASPSPTLSNYMSGKNQEPQSTPLVMGADCEPEPVAETLTPEPETGSRLNLEPESSDLNTCLECKSPTSNAYRCDRCVEDAARRDAERWSA